MKAIVYTRWGPPEVLELHDREKPSPGPDDVLVRIHLVVLQQMLTSGKIVPAIDRSYPLADVADAVKYLIAGHARGKVVITV